MFTRLRTKRSVFSVLLAAGLVLLPVLVGYAQGELQLGNQSYTRAAAPALRMPVTRSVRFFRGVGGVAFSAVAKGQLGRVVTELRYDPTALDGQRLVIVTSSPNGTPTTVRGAIYDWQLVPIANYANDENGSAVTLFGRLSDQTREADTHSARGRVINYHPQLDNTLLGLRLFQADILIFQPNAADLFSQNGQAILGAGERGHDLAKNQDRYRQIAQWQESQEQLGNSYQSYVVGDLDQQVTFAVQGGAISFTGSPYWAAWRPKHRSSADRAKIERLADDYRTKAESHDAVVRAAKASSVAPTISTLLRLQTLKTEIDSIEKQLEELNAIEEMPEVQPGSDPAY